MKFKYVSCLLIKHSLQIFNKSASAFKICNFYKRLSAYGVFSFLNQTYSRLGQAQEFGIWFSPEFESLLGFDSLGFSAWTLDWDLDSGLSILQHLLFTWHHWQPIQIDRGRKWFGGRACVSQANPVCQPIVQRNGNLCKSYYIKSSAEVFTAQMHSSP